MASSTPGSDPDDPSDAYWWSEFPRSGRGHLVEKEGAERPVPDGDGGVEMQTMTLCGNATPGETRSFKGFDGHRNIDWCDMCKHLYHQRHEGEGLFGP